MSAENKECPVHRLLRLLLIVPLGVLLFSGGPVLFAAEAITPCIINVQSYELNELESTFESSVYPCKIPPPPPPDLRPTQGDWNTLPYTMKTPRRGTFSAAHSAMLHTGRVLFLPEGDTTNTLLWDPTDEVNPNFDFPDTSPTDWLFCSGHSFLSDGQLLVAGGGGNAVSGAIDRAWRFDPDAGTNGTWTKTLGDMAQRRWYPTVITIGYPYVLVASGIYGTNLWADELEVYDELTDSFTIVTGGTRVLPETYPGLHLLPTGKVLYTQTGFGHFSWTNETSTTAAYFEFNDLNNPFSGSWTDMTSLMNYPDRTERMSTSPRSRHPVWSSSEVGTRTRRVVRKSRRSTRRPCHRPRRGIPCRIWRCNAGTRARWCCPTATPLSSEVTTIPITGPPARRTPSFSTRIRKPSRLRPTWRSPADITR